MCLKSYNSALICLYFDIKYYMTMAIVIILSSFNCIALSKFTILSTEIIHDTWHNNHYLTEMTHNYVLNYFKYV